MVRMLALAQFFDRVSRGAAAIAVWLFFVLVAVICIDVVTRKFNLPIPFLDSTRLQELEWHIHGALFLLCLGYSYLMNTHVRIDVLSTRAAPRTRAWIELLGCLFLALPFCIVLVAIGWDFFQQSFAQGERSDAATGLAYRWIIKGVIPVGIVLLLAAVIAVGLRQIAFLFGPPAPRDQAKPV